MRLFVAADIPDELLYALAETQAALRATLRGRYVPPDALHVTLAFLGEVAAHDVSRLSEVVRLSLCGLGSVRVTLGELGSFGPARKATLWQAVEGTDITWLAESVRDALADAGFAHDRTRFCAHVTLMRGADITRGMLPAPCMVASALDAVCIYRSFLNPDGATYEVLDRVRLAAPTVV